MDYKVEKTYAECDSYRYVGYIDNEYAGYVSGYEVNSDTFNIQKSKLMEQFIGTKSVRAFSEIIKAVHKDYYNIRSRIDNQDNSEIKIVLSAGFKIIGTVSHNGEIAVELLKTREDI